MGSLQLKLDHPELDDVLSRAYIRVEQYLCALQIHNKRILSELTHAIVADMRNRVLEGDKREPTEIAMRAIDQHVRTWYEEISGVTESHVGTDRIRLCLFRADMARQWSRYFLRDSDIPSPFKEQMRKRALISTPEITEPQSIQPEHLDLGKIGKWADDTWRLFGKWPILGALSAGCGYILLLVFVIYFASL